MVETLVVSLPSLGNISALLALVITIFAVLGVTFFYNVNLEQDRYGRMDEHNNYKQFDNALWTLHRQTTARACSAMLFRLLCKAGKRVTLYWSGGGMGKHHVLLLYPPSLPSL